MIVRARRAAAVLAGIAVVLTLTFDGSYLPEAVARQPRERNQDRGREFVRQEQQIRRSRRVTRRVLRDRRASPEMKQQATELQGLLDRREATVAALETRHKAFVDQHRAEIQEIEELRDRAQVLDQRLSTARDELLQASAGEIAELKGSSARAAALVEALRQGYVEQRRARRAR